MGIPSSPTSYGGLQSLFEKAAAAARSRASWNDRFDHWMRPASDTEEATIERAANMVRQSLANSDWLKGEKVVVVPQGSYHNNTNVRREADADLRVVHPGLHLHFHSTVTESTARTLLGYSNTDRYFETVNRVVRSEAERELRDTFGGQHIKPGNKAIRIKGLDGSRGEVDVVPCFTLHYVSWNGVRYDVTEGVAILRPGTSGSFILNFPEQHCANGKAKRARTGYRFKKYVRIFKRLRNDMVDSGYLPKGYKAPSFLVECLTYAVEDDYFNVEADDHYDRSLRILKRMRALLTDDNWVRTATEINEIKFLFHADQAWTLDDAKVFVNSAIARIEA